MSDILLSIILPVYNVEKFLLACLDSIFSQMQGSDQIEIIAVNDGSTDRSGQILADYAQTYPEVLQVFSIANGGVSHARNLGVSKAHGRFLWFVDSDDLIAPKAFSRLLPLLQKQNPELVLFGHTELHPDRGSVEKPLSLASDISTLRSNPWLLAQVSPYPWDKVIRRDFYGETAFPEGIRFEDLPIMLLTAARASSILVLPNCLYGYRTNVGFLGGLTEQALDVLSALQILRTLFWEHDLLDTYEEVLEFIAVKHCFLRFRQILWNFEPNTRALKENIVHSCFAYLNETYPNWSNHEQVMQQLPDFLRSRVSLFSSEKKMLRFVRLCADRPEVLQRAYIKLFCS